MENQPQDGMTELTVEQLEFLIERIERELSLPHITSAPTFDESNPFEMYKHLCDSVVYKPSKPILLSSLFAEVD